MEKLCIARVLMLRNNNIFQCIWSHWTLWIQLLTCGLQCWMPQLLCQMETQSHGHWGLTCRFLYFHSLALSAIYTTRLLPKAIHHPVTCYSLTRCPTEPLLMDHHIRLTSFSIEHNSARAQSEMICCMKMDLWAQSCLSSVVSTQH